MTDYSNTPEHKVAMEVRAVSSGISNLWKMRLDSETADEVLKSEGDLYAALGTLRSLVEDIRESNDKTVTAPSLVAAE